MQIPVIILKMYFCKKNPKIFFFLFSFPSMGEELKMRVNPPKYPEPSYSQILSDI